MADERSPSSDPLADPEERRVLLAALDSFRQYRQAAHYNITHLRRQSFYSLPSAQVDLLSAPPFSVPQKFRDVDDAIDSNAEIAEAILKIALPSFGIEDDDTSWHGYATPSDLDKARSTIRQLYRDWTAAGIDEFRASFDPIMGAFEEHLVDVIDPRDRYKNKVLVPGAGLGRLVFDLCCAGYTAEGNEISYHQLLASNYFLNYTKAAHQHTLYPWALNFSNHMTRDDQLRSYGVPDIHPESALKEAQVLNGSRVHYNERMSMTAGDFCSVYRKAEYENFFDAVVTCYFIDTAPNVISYVDTVKHCLKPNGIWINLGPLLWHFESVPTPAERMKARNRNNEGQRQRRPLDQEHEDGIGAPGSFELSNEDLLALVESSGFQVLEQGQPLDARSGYIQNPNSMLQNIYHPSFWVARLS